MNTCYQIAAVGMVAFALMSGAAEPVPRTFFGMTMNKPPAVWPEAGFRAIRLWDSGTSWYSMNPAPGVYQWEKFDRWLDLAAKNHVDVLYTFGRTPQWASSQPGLGRCSFGPGQCAPPSDSHAWDDFVRAIVFHSAGRVHAWELWNEANTPEGWSGDIGTLRDMSLRAYAIIKQAQPDAVVLTPSATGSGGPEWMARYLSGGGAAAADKIAFHGYCCPSDPEKIAELIARYRSVAAESGNKGLWDTEASWGKATKLPEESARVAFVARAYALHWSGGVERFYWYAWDNPEWGSLAPNGVVRPSGRAYAELVRWLSGASLSSPCVGQDGDWSCAWMLGDGSAATLAWSNHGVVLSAKPPWKHVRELNGSQRVIKKIEQLTAAPLMLVADPPTKVAASRQKEK